MREYRNMVDKMRWRYGDTNPVIAAVKSAIVINIGNLLWDNLGHTEPASSLPLNGKIKRCCATKCGFRSWIHGPDTDWEQCRKCGSSDWDWLLTEGSLRDRFAQVFLGVAMQRSLAGWTDDIRVATTGVFEFDCFPSVFELGDPMGVDEDKDGKVLSDIRVCRVGREKISVGQIARREPVNTEQVLVAIRSRVMHQIKQSWADDPAFRETHGIKS